MDVTSECSTKKNSMSFTRAVLLSFFLQSYTQHGFSLEFSGLLLMGFWWHTLSGCWVFDWGILVAPVQLLQYIQPFQHTTMCQLCLPHWHPHLWNGTSDLILNTGIHKWAMSSCLMQLVCCNAWWYKSLYMSNFFSLSHIVEKLKQCCWCYPLYPTGSSKLWRKEHNQEQIKVQSRNVLSHYHTALQLKQLCTNLCIGWPDANPKYFANTHR